MRPQDYLVPRLSQVGGGTWLHTTPHSLTLSMCTVQCEHFTRQDGVDVGVPSFPTSYPQPLSVQNPVKRVKRAWNLIFPFCLQWTFHFGRDSLLPSPVHYVFRCLKNMQPQVDAKIYKQIRKHIWYQASQYVCDGRWHAVTPMQCGLKISVMYIYRSLGCFDCKRYYKYNASIRKVLRSRRVLASTDVPFSFVVQIAHHQS